MPERLNWDLGRSGLNRLAQASKGPFSCPIELGRSELNRVEPARFNLGFNRPLLFEGIVLGRGGRVCVSFLAAQCGHLGTRLATPAVREACRDLFSGCVSGHSKNPVAPHASCLRFPDPSCMVAKAEG